MMQEALETMTVEEKKQALLDRFSSYQQQDTNCARIVTYLNSSQSSEQMIERLRAKLQDVRSNRDKQYKQTWVQIRTAAEQVYTRERDEAEELLGNW